MFWLMRRLVWFVTGASLGFGGAMWIRSRLLRAVDRLAPEHVQADVAAGVRRVGTQVGEGVTTARDVVRDAVVEGRSAMARREAELRDQLHP
jgi:hypothetical protein